LIQFKISLLVPLIDLSAQKKRKKALLREKRLKKRRKRLFYEKKGSKKSASPGALRGPSRQRAALGPGSLGPAPPVCALSRETLN
jgi:ribosomal protein S21